MWSKMLRSEKNESHGRGRDFLKKATETTRKHLKEHKRGCYFSSLLLTLKYTNNYGAERVRTPRAHDSGRFVSTSFFIVYTRRSRFAFARVSLRFPGMRESA